MGPAKSSKAAAVTGKDIRSFFGGAGGEPAKSKSDRMMLDIDDSPPKKASLKRKNIVVVSSDEEDESATPSPPKKKMAVAAKAAPKVVASTSRSKVTESKVVASASTSKLTAPKVVASASTSKVAAATSKVKPSRKVPVKSKRAKDDEFVVDSEEEAEETEDDYDDEEDVKPEKKGKAKPSPTAKPSPKKAPPQKAPAPKADKGKAKEEDAAPSTKPFNWAAAKAAKLAGPSAPGSKQVPQSKSPDCLAGLAFVFTGELSSFARDEAVDLAKRFGGRVVGQPSSKTSFVVLGDNAGPSKLAAIKKHNIKTLSEDEFLNLIATREGPGGPGGAGLDDKTKKKMAKEQETIKQAAKALEQREKQASKEADKSGSSKTDVSSQLWTTRYAPQSLKEICGNKGNVEKIQQWLHDWSGSLKCGFKKPGKNGMNVYRAVMITGPPGIGKTTSAHLCAKLEGFTPIELNASDARSKKLVESGMNISNLSLDGWMGGNDATNAAGVKITDKTCLIMDEVDGMSAGDRGGVGALNALIKKTKIPIICIANDKGAQKLKPLAANTFGITFRRPEAQAVRSRIMTIAYKEKMKIPANVVDQLIAGSQSDIRQVLNMLSTWRLSSSSMDFDEAKNLAKTNEKYTILSPFDVTYKILGPYAFGPSARETLGDKMELYFHDHSFVPLFIQENYLKTQPVKVRDLEGPPKMLKQLELMDRAASSISDADLVDALIHGPEQHWSLMPLHAVCSMVRPASFLFGAGSGYGGQNPMTFPQWLGQNSKQNKLSRQLGDVQVRMRLKVSGDKHEIRQSYIPALFPHVVKPLIDQGAAAVDDVIERMDEYYLSREDWDTVVELGVDTHKDDIVTKLVKPATKASFTRKYNSMDHPIPFHKATDLGKAPKKLAGGPAPDLEDVFDLDDEVVDVSDDEKKNVRDEDEVAADKLFQASKPKAQSQKAKTTTIKGKKAQNFM
ncbi:replication factor RFC1 C terminal domain-containing protein [Suillus paluster]|uniref:replication factor RFC1 C terminal domain-containing protein n=1 Tax=Suillus paluster TaxID=48578 RepID=UPI001B86CCFC|nr:replication factor RFC1 C terminal domain-containing protein [Suillus paluster]KAG1740228.1 replication factor RFC1 C terminal domain-containing protein [Suillus paluster]